MKTTKLNSTRWILLFLTFFFPVLLTQLDHNGLGDNPVVMVFMLVLLLGSWVAALYVFIYKRATISPGIKITLVSLIPLLSVSYLATMIDFKESSFFDNYLQDLITIMLFASFILSCICYLEKIEIILMGLLGVTLIGFIMNRAGIEVGGVIFVPLGFFFSSAGFIYLTFRTIFKRDRNSIFRKILILFCGVISVLNILFLIKFSEYRPALANIYDIIGVIIFLLACLTLLIILPFSNFTEWEESQKASFKRLILFPFLFFLLIFSLKFLLPENTYRKIFYKEYGAKGVEHFRMKDYEINFENDND